MGILNFGSLNIDKVYKVSHFAQAGETISSESFNCFPGGKGLNQSIAIAKAGEAVFHAGTIGKDGKFLEHILTQHNVDIRYLRRTETVTGHAVIQVSEEGENCIILFQGSNGENTKDYIEEVLRDFDKGDVLLLQNEISNLDYLLRRGHEKGMKIMLNPSPVDRTLKEADLSVITWLMLNEVEGQELTGEVEPDLIVQKLHERYPEVKIILTLGKKGSIYFSSEETIHQKCYPAEVVDTTAAGDTFTGYFTAAVVRGLSVREALNIASCAASLTVTREGAAISIPWEDEVTEKIRGV